MSRVGRLEIGRSPLAAAAAMFALVFAVRLWIDGAATGVSLLYTVPILLVTIAYGTRAGILAATFAVGLTVAWTQLQDVYLAPLAYLMRALAFYAVPCTVGLARPTPESAEVVAAPMVESETAVSPRPLTRRESEVLGLLAAGHTNAQIADRLVVSVRTVESHRANLQRKLGRPSRPELVQHALRQGLMVQRPRFPF